MLRSVGSNYRLKVKSLMASQGLEVEMVDSVFDPDRKRAPFRWVCADYYVKTWSSYRAVMRKIVSEAEDIKVCITEFCAIGKLEIEGASCIQVCDGDVTTIGDVKNLREGIKWVKNRRFLD